MRTEDAIAAVEQNIEQDSHEYNRHCDPQSKLCLYTLWSHLGLRSYKIQIVQILSPNDYQMRRTLGEWAQTELASKHDFHKEILYSEEVKFWLNAFFNPQAIAETPWHLQNIHFW